MNGYPDRPLRPLACESCGDRYLQITVRSPSRQPSPAGSACRQAPAGGQPAGDRPGEHQRSITTTMAEQQLIDAEQLLAELESVEARLDRLQAGLRQSHRLATLGTLAAIVAHEFNNILTPVISYAQLALASADGPSPDLPLIRKALQRALDGSQKAAHISSTILGFARDADAGPRSANVAAAVDDVFTCLARDPAKDGIALRLDIPADLRVAIRPVALQQVLLNLVLNARAALKSARRSTGRSLAITARPADDDRILITVADTGPGIPADLLPRIFDPFVTHSPAPAPAPGSKAPGKGGAENGDDASGGRKGTGLGLAVCRDLVQQAAGAIDVETCEGHGTTFRIELPAVSEGR